LFKVFSKIDLVFRNNVLISTNSNKFTYNVHEEYNETNFTGIHFCEVLKATTICWRWDLAAGGSQQREKGSTQMMIANHKLTYRVVIGDWWGLCSTFGSLIVLLFQFLCFYKYLLSIVSTSPQDLDESRCMKT